MPTATPLKKIPAAAAPLAEDYTLRLCEQLARWRYEDLPAEVVRMLKFFLLDTLGVIAGAANAPGIRELNQRLSKWESGGSATGLIGRRRYSPPSAALANGAAAHALDFDDQHDPARVHTNCVVLPALLATAEDIGNDGGKVSGRDFLLAYAISTELHARLGLACYNSLGKGWHPTMVFGTPSASLGAARLLKLDAEGMRNALGMAFHQTSGSAQSMRDGVISKRLGAGFAARSAVLGAFLAADGLTGTRRTLEGNAGLFALYERDEVKTDLITKDLGKHWRITEYSFKPYPCCRCNHTPIGLGIQLREQGVKPSDVRSVEIGMGNVNWLTVGEPYDVRRDSVVHAQFNASYTFARALADARVDLRSFQKPAISDPAIVALAAKVRAVDDPAIDPTAIEPARVTVTLNDGRVVEVKSDTVKGSPQEPMSEDELLAKFRDCLDFGVGAKRADADRLADAIMHVDSSTDVGAMLVGAFPQTTPSNRG
ncbi:MAG TPA: MmgE/PrpD family protein [Burkholderiales bacterium]|nr:MmgE/PrpD family protein [Burkholderiales bacterium]